MLKTLNKLGLPVAVMTLMSWGPASALPPEDRPPLATQEEVEEAYARLGDWVEAHRTGDNITQRDLTDPRIRAWRPMRTWRRMMNSARRRDGDLLSIDVVGFAPIHAEDIPCTEMDHCHREGVRYVIFFLETEYERASPQQPEYALMAESNEGWRFAGGSFPNRPMLETMAIMTEEDEREISRRSMEERF